MEETLNRWFKGNDDDERRAYVTIGRLKRAILTNPKVPDALLDSLGVPGKPSMLRRLPPKDKLKAILDYIEQLTKTQTSIFHGQRDGVVLAAAIWQSSLSNKFVETELFSAVRKEADLLAPVTKWLKSHEFETFAEIPMGKKRVDLVGHRAPSWGGLRGRRIVAIELKNDVKEFERAIDQMSTYMEYSHDVFLAATPAMCAQYLDDHVSARGVTRYDSDILDKKLRALGFGLLLVEGHVVTNYLPARSGSPDGPKLDEVVLQLRDKARV